MANSDFRRKRRTEILVKEGGSLAARIAEEVQSHYGTVVLQEPTEGLVMVKLRERARNSLFYIGEVLVTEAKAEVAGFSGLGVVQGTNEELALQLAIIDAAWNAHVPETETWSSWLSDAAEAVATRESEENGRIMETRVNFVSMQEEEPL